VQRNNSRTTTFTLSALSYQTNSCDGATSGNGWINCTSALPTTRVLAKELSNFATWYSNYRSRIKAAKASAAEAFNPLGNKVRVGYRSLHQNGSSDLNIPVTDGNDGRFVNNDGTNGNPVTTSRSKWFNRLFKAKNDGGTPLQTALNNAGQYFSSSAADGPYGGVDASQLSCRQNFAILTTDGYWNTSVVNTGNFGDGTNGSTITNGLLATDPNYKSYQYTKPAPYSDSYTNTLADVAMRYWKTDLRPDLDNNVPSGYSKVAGENDQIGRDPAFWQHMVTFTIALGLRTSSGLSSVAEVTASTTWPNPDTSNPGNDTQYRLDDLLHAAVNGRGTFVSASSPQAFSDGLAAALAKIDERTASFSNAGASDSTQLNTGTLIFNASYVAGRWSGLLRAEKAVGGTEVWKTTDAGTFATRKVFTRSGAISATTGTGADGTGGGTTFPTTDQEAALARTGGPANFEVTGANNAQYIKGDASLEGSAPGKLRVRSTVLGDIVNSSPAYVADSDAVFIGANDGMLHAFNATTGKELFAYVPNIINFGNLADLSRGDYEHHWFVDGPIAISPLALGPGGNKNILVGTLGRGGRGVYALDVTNPSGFASSNVKWERSSTSATASADNMGMVLGAPVLAKVREGTTTATPAVVLGNGINSRSGKAALLVLDMDTGRVIREIPTDNTTDNGLFAPTGIYAADGKTLVYAYAGDLQGNVWKFDLTSTTPSSWSSRKIFHAEKTAGTPQPITGGIASAVDPRTNKRWVFFGTGSYLTAADGNDAGEGKQSMYGIIDDVGATDSAHLRADLAARSVTAEDGTGERFFQKLTGTMLTGKHGWYVDLPDKGERIVQNAQIDGSYLVTASMMPSGNSCSDATGSGYINAVTPFPDMSASDRSYFDRDGDGKTDDTGTAGQPTGSIKTSGMPTLPLLLPGELRYQTSSGTGETLDKSKPRWSRVSWRELRND
jgi:type IV pilus assembly protein PilY1